MLAVGQKVLNSTIQNKELHGVILMKELENSFIVEWYYREHIWREVNNTSSLKIDESADTI